MTKVKTCICIRLSFGVALLTAILCGCGGVDPYKPDYAKSAAQVRLAELVGTYVPTRDTAAKIKNEGHYTAAKIFITLSANKSFQASNIPDWWGDSFGKSRGMFDSGGGTWSVVDSQRGAAIELTFNSRKGLHSTIWFESRSLSKLVYLIGQKPPYLLHMPVGDTMEARDEGKMMQFEKVTQHK